MTEMSCKAQDIRSRPNFVGETIIRQVDHQKK